MPTVIKTTYHLPDNTPYEEIRIVNVQIDDLHRYEAARAIKVGAPFLSDFIRKGLTEGWIKVIQE